MKHATIFEPDEPNELLRGWLLHAHKGRDRHDLAARHFDQRRYLLGGTAAFISGIVGTSTFTALQSSTARAIQVVVGVLAIAAAVLTSVQAVLDFGARAERHRIAGVRYKHVIRELEQLGIGAVVGLKLDAPILTEIRQRLDALEEEMPVVPPRIYERIEQRYRNVAFVDAVRPDAAAGARPAD
jgi:hypothetical protein